MNLGLIKEISLKSTVKALIVCVLVLGPLAVTPYAVAAEKNSVSASRESYLDRPDILTLKPKAASFDDSWTTLKSAHFSFVASLLEMYPDREFYFLARDSEHLYDVARLVTEGTPEASRIHLLNVSRGNMRDPHIVDYLKENGISEASLSGGRQVLFVDTGFAGTIPRVIAENYSKQAAAHIKTQLIVSSNPDHPSARTFLFRLNPLINDQLPSSMHGTIINYEHMPRYTDRSDRYELINGQWHPTSPLDSVEMIDGEVSKERAIAQMRDLKAEWAKASVRELYSYERKQTRRLIKLLKSQDTAASIASIRKSLETLPESARGHFEAVLRDLIGAQNNAGIKTEVSLAEVGLKADPTSKFVGKSVVIAKNPKWAKYLENPDVGIPNLIAEKNWQLIGTFIDMNIDAEINKLIGLHLFSSTGPEVQKELRLAYLKSEHIDDFDVKGKIIPLIAAAENFSFMQEEAIAVLKMRRFRMELLRNLADLPDGLTTQAINILNEGIKLSAGDNFELRTIIKDVIGTKNAVKYRQTLMTLIKLQVETEKKSRSHHEYIAEFVFNDPAVAMQLRPELNELLKQNPKSSYELMQHLFSKPGSDVLHAEFKSALAALPDYLADYAAKYVFSQPHSIKFKDLIIPYSERNQGKVDFALMIFFFSQPQTAQEIGLLRMLIESNKGHFSALATLDEYIFNKDFAQTTEHRILRKSLDIPDPAERQTFIDREFRQRPPSRIAPGQCRRVFFDL